MGWTPPNSDRRRESLESGSRAAFTSRSRSARGESASGCGRSGLLSEPVPSATLYDMKVRAALSLPTLLVALPLALQLPACRAVQSVADAPGKVTKALLPGQQAPNKTPISELHPELLRCADFSIERLRAATEAFEEAAGTPEAELQAVQWRVNLTRQVLQSATGPVPLSGTLDLLTGLTASELVFEKHLIPNVWGDAGQPMLTAIQASEQQIWQTLSSFFTAAQIASLQGVLDSWTEMHHDSYATLNDDLPTFGEIVQALGDEDEGGGGFLGLARLDPLAGLEPMAREVALTRQFAERMLFWSERLPTLIDDQVELGTLEARRLPEVVQVLADVERVSLAAETLAATAAELPDKITAEREAALRQASDEIGALRDATLSEVSAELTSQREATLRDLSTEITAQREGLVNDLTTAREPLESLLGESRSTFDAAQGMTAELNALVAAVGVFLDRFESPEEESDTPAATEPAASAEPAEPTHPFDITEYGDTAVRLGEAAAELRELVTTLDGSVPQVEELVDAAASRGDATIDHAFRRGLQLGLGLIAAAAAAVVLVRLATRRGAPPAPRS